MCFYMCLLTPTLARAADLKLRAKWHVGDTPMDIQAAGGGQAKALGVLTGVYSRQDLEGCGAGAHRWLFYAILCVLLLKPH